MPTPSWHSLWPVYIPLSLDLFSLTSSESSPPHLSAGGVGCDEVYEAGVGRVYDSPAIEPGAHLSTSRPRGTLSLLRIFVLPSGDASQRVLA